MACSSSLIHFSCVTYGELILVSHQSEPENYISIIRTILPLVPRVPGEKKLTFPAQRFQIHVLADDTELVYSCITDPTDSHLLPFTFLDAVRTKFTGIASLAENASTANENEYDRDFAPLLAAVVFNFNIGQGGQLSVLETQLHDVKKIILKNVEKLIERGDELEDLVMKSENVTVKNVDFRQADRTVRRQKCKNWRMWLVIGSLLGTLLSIALLIASGAIRL